MHISKDFIIFYFAAGFVFSSIYLFASYRRRREVTCQDFIFAFLIFQVWAHAILLHGLLNKIFKKDFVVFKKRKRL